MTLVAGISAVEALAYFEGETDVFVSMMVVSSAFVGGSLTGLLCKIFFGPPAAPGRYKIARGIGGFEDDYFKDAEDMIREQYYRDDMTRGLPNIPGDPTINKTWPNI